MSIGSIEPQFYALLLEKTGLSDDPDFRDSQRDGKAWPELSARLREVFLQKTRDQWCELMEGSDVCFAPVLNIEEALEHPHNLARKTFVEVAGVKQPGAGPPLRTYTCQARLRHLPRPASTTARHWPTGGSALTAVERLEADGGHRLMDDQRRRGRPASVHDV